MQHKQLSRFAISLIIFTIYGCFQSKKGGEEGTDEADISTLMASPDEGGETIAEIMCDYYQRCPNSSVICSVQSSGNTVHADCRVEKVPFVGDECLQRLSPAIAKALKCAQLTDELERKVNRCLKELRFTECIEMTDDRLRAYEESVERGDGASPGGVPEPCMGLEDFFSCGDDKTDDLIEVTPVSNLCIPGESRPCICPDGISGIQDCLKDGSRLGTCECQGDINRAATPGDTDSNTAGVGGGVPVAACVVNQSVSCTCSDGSLGVAVCLDGTRFSECKCSSDPDDSA